MTTTQKVTDDKIVKITYEDNGIEISMKYSRYSTLETRYALLDKFKEVLRKL